MNLERCKGSSRFSGGQARLDASFGAFLRVLYARRLSPALGPRSCSLIPAPANAVLRIFSSRLASFSKQLYRFRRQSCFPSYICLPQCSIFSKQVSFFVVLLCNHLESIFSSVPLVAPSSLCFRLPLLFQASLRRCGSLQSRVFSPVHCFSPG